VETVDLVEVGVVKRVELAAQEILRQHLHHKGIMEVLAVFQVETVQEGAAAALLRLGQTELLEPLEVMVATVRHLQFQAHL
jgi:hypothetical protein